MDSKEFEKLLNETKLLKEKRLEKKLLEEKDREQSHNARAVFEKAFLQNCQEDVKEQAIQPERRKRYG